MDSSCCCLTKWESLSSLELKKKCSWNFLSISNQELIKPRAKDENQEKGVPNRDKENMWAFKVSIELASLDWDKYWLIWSWVLLLSSPLNLIKSDNQKFGWDGA